MTNDKFRELCERVLIPLVGDLLHRQFIDILETIDVISNELLRLGDRLDQIGADLNAHCHDQEN